MEHATRPERLQESLAVGHHQVLRIILVFRFLFGVEVIEIAEELVEAVDRWQVFVEVAFVVLAELSGGVALPLENGGHRYVGFLPALRGTGQADLSHA